MAKGSRDRNGKFAEGNPGDRAAREDRSKVTTWPG